VKTVLTCDMKLLVYIFLCLGVSWTVAGLMHLNDVPYNSIAGKVIIALGYMPGPAIAAVLTHIFLYKGGWSRFGFNFKHINYWGLALVPAFYLGYCLLTLTIVFSFGNLLGIVDFGIVSFNNDLILSNIEELSGFQFDRQSVNMPPPVVLLLICLGAGVLAGATVNTAIALGEEIGWRGFMFNELRQYGFLRSSTIIGFCWGLWHVPVILMGHNFPHHPITGSIVMIVFCIALSMLHSIVRRASNTVLAPAALHGMINAGAPGILLFISNENELFGSIVGVAGILSALLVTGAYLLIRNILSRKGRLVTA